MCVCIIVCVGREGGREIFMNWHIMETDKYEVPKSRPEGQKFRQNFYVSLETEFFLFQKLIRPSTDWMTSTQIIDSNHIYLKSVDFKCQLYLQNAFIATPRLDDLTIGTIM